jgi:DNA-binding transcriptional LysR family regulator
MRYNLQHFKTFVAVAQAGSVTKATQQLGFSQPAVSAHLAHLEHALGDLVIRGRRGVSLTPLAEDVFKSCVRIVAELDQLERLAASGLECKELRFGATASVAAGWLFRRLETIAATCPGTQLSVQVLDREQLALQLLNYTLEFALMEMPREEPPDAFLQRVEVGHEDLHLVAESTYPISDEDLRNATLIVGEIGSNSRFHAEMALGDKLEKFGRTLEIQDEESIKEAVLSGLGVGVLPALTMERELRAGWVKRVAPDRWRAVRVVELVRLKSRNLPGYAETLWRSRLGYEPK